MSDLKVGDRVSWWLRGSFEGSVTGIGDGKATVEWDNGVVTTPVLDRLVKVERMDPVQKAYDDWIAETDGAPGLFDAFRAGAAMKESV